MQHEHTINGKPCTVSIDWDRRKQGTPYTATVRYRGRAITEAEARSEREAISEAIALAESGLYAGRWEAAEGH